MIIEEVENPESLKVVATKQNIDQKLGVPPPFIDKPAVYVVSGGMGSGKSTFMNSIMTAGGKNKVFKGAFDHIHYSTPPEVFTSDPNHPFNKHELSRLYFELTPSMLDDITDDAIRTKEDGGCSCLILDDWSEELKDRRIELRLKKLIHKHRHYKLNIIISLLTLKSLPRQLRSLVDVFVIFKPKSQIELGTFAEEVFAMPKKDINTLFEFVYQDPYDFLLYNQRSNKYHRNFNKLKITNKE
jgi:hypothetical protein